MKIAVVGSGVSGLAATWLLNEHSDHEVHLFEADDRAGGHANTVVYQVDGRDVHVDAGFSVFDPTVRPNFHRFLKRYPDITLLSTKLSFSVSRNRGMFEWADKSLAGVFCQPSRMLDPSMWRLLYDILRFNACARKLVIDVGENCSVAEYLAQEGYSDIFRDDYLLPMTAAIWCNPPEKSVLDMPVQTLIIFMSKHHMLQVMRKPAWLTIKGGSHQYVDAILENLPEGQLHLSTPIKSVGNTPCSTTVQLTTADGRSLDFDRVIMACHSDTTLALLVAGGGATEEEKKILGRFTWNRNEAVLHHDTTFMPKSRVAWSCWNYSAVDGEGMHKDQANVNKVSVTCMRFIYAHYNMNLLQHLPQRKYGLVFLTLNPRAEPARGTVTARFQYDHPVLNTNALASMREMGNIQGRRGILYAGAWLGYGCHEDGFTSGLRAVVHHIDGVQLPFAIAPSIKPVYEVFVARVFDIFEESGARIVFGRFLSYVLALLRKLLLVDDVGRGNGSM